MSGAPPPDLPLPGDWSRRRLLGVALLGQALLALCALRHVFVYGGALHWLLNGLEVVGLVAAVMAGGIALSRAVRQASSLEVGYLLRVGLLLTAVAALAPAFLSNDLWDYVARGRVEALGHNPYVTAASALRDDPAMAPFLGPEFAKWPDWVMPYGPVAAVLQRLCASVDSPWLAAWLFKLCMALAHVATAVVIYRTVQLCSGERDARRGLVLWLWNPWLLLECCGSAHNDALLALGLALTAYGVARARYGLAAGSYGLGMLVKHGAPPIGVLLLASALRQRRLAGFALGAAVSAGVTAVAYAHYWSVPGGLDWITNQNAVARGSVASLLGALLGDGAATAVRAAGALATLALLVLACRRVRSPQGFARLAALTMVVFVLLFVPNFAPWYHLWWLPLFGLAGVPVLARVVELLAWTGPLSYLVLAGSHGFGALHELWMLLLAGIWPALLVLLDWRSLLAEPAAARDAGRGGAA